MLNHDFEGNALCHQCYYDIIVSPPMTLNFHGKAVRIPDKEVRTGICERCGKDAKLGLITFTNLYHYRESDDPLQYVVVEEEDGQWHNQSLLDSCSV